MQNKCAAAVVFHSGTSVDMARIGMPVIEYLNPEHVDPGNGVFKYRQAGFVLPARNRDEFLSQVSQVLHDRDAALAPVQSSIGREFPRKKT